MPTPPLLGLAVKLAGSNPGPIFLPIRPSQAVTIPILSLSRISYTVRGGAVDLMGAFLFGLIVGFAAALALFIYDEGEVFLKLARQIKLVAGKYKQEHRAEPRV